MLRACTYTQDDLLDVRIKEPMSTPVMTSKFNLRNHNIKKFIGIGIIIQHSNNVLTKAFFSYPPNEIKVKEN